MKKIILCLSLAVSSIALSAQNGLENIIVEKYYISNAADAAGSIGNLPTGSTTYRVFVDMLPGYKFQAAYGLPGHELRIKTTTTFFNNEDRGATTPAFTKTQAAGNTVMLDSWFSVGAACTGNFGVLKTEDNGVANVVNANGILQNNDPGAGIPLTTQDGFLAGAPEAVTFVGLSAGDLSVFDNVSGAGNLFTTTNGSIASLVGSTGPTSTNRVLIAQLTTNGCLSFELNIQIGTPTGGVQNYVARNPSGNEILLPALLYNAAGVSISASPSGIICSGTSVTFTATPSNGGASPVYQWKKNNGNVGTNSPVYTTTGLANNNLIKCVMTSNATLCVAGAVTSNTITALVNTSPTATITVNGPTTYCSGTNALTLTANSGVGFTYQWKKGSANISGATGISYNPTSSGTYTYKVVVTSSNGCSKTSAGVSVTVNGLPTATISTTGPTTFCSGANALTLTANSGTGYTYQWLKGTTTLAGATNISYNPTSTGTYKVVVTNSNGCSKTSAGVAVTVNALPSASVTAQGPTTFCPGDSVQLLASSGTGLTYQWKKNGVNISGATSISYYAKTTGTYKVTVTNSNGCSKTSGTGVSVTASCRMGDSDLNIRADQLTIYPNPANSQFAIRLSNDVIGESMARIEIINTLGQSVYTSQAKIINGQLNEIINRGSNFSNGLYFVKVWANGVLYESKLALQ
ncbi:MAG: T9SS type A sorting domain-containing protein [Bacteroidia bacterium]